MLWFYLKEFVFDPLKDKGKDYVLETKSYKSVFDKLFEFHTRYHSGINDLGLLDDNHDMKHEPYLCQIFRDIDQLLNKFFNVLKEHGINDYKRIQRWLQKWRVEQDYEFYQKIYN